jgi:phage antirepressor YoqD-like protein
VTVQPIGGQPELGSFEFHGDQVVVVTDEHGSWAVLGQLCQNLTLDAESQRQAIGRKSWSEGKTCVMQVMLPGQDRAYPQFLIHERIVPMWLANITTSRIKDGAKRDKVEQAQAELADALYAYVTNRGPKPAELTRLEILRMALEAEEQNQVLRAEKLELTSKVAELAPMAAQAEHYRSADGLIAVADFANDLKGWAKQIHDVRVLHPEVWDFLGEIGLIIRGNTIRRNRPTAFAIEKDYVREKKTTFDTSTRGLQASWSPRLTPAGAGYAWDKAVIRITEYRGLRTVEAA